MNKIYVVLAIILISMSTYSQTNTSKWLNTPMTIDGNNTDWGGRLSYYESECTMFYELKNDSNYLFLIFEIASEKSQTKFMHAGFEVAMKVKTKPKLNATINFLPQQRQEHSMQEDEGFHNPNGMQQTYLLNSRYAEVTGFLKTNEMINRNVNGNEEFTYNIGWNDLNNMLIEIQIPIYEVFTTADSELDYTQTTISLTCKLNALERPSGEQMRSGGSGMHGGGSREGMSGGGRAGGGGRSNGGGGRPDGQRASSGDMQTMSSVQTFKAKYVLSKGN